MVWKKGIALAKLIYQLTAEAPLSKDFGLKDQLRRASVSISANIAEGFERANRKEYVQFLNIAKGSAGELRSLIRVAFEVGYLSAALHETLRKATLEESRFLSNHIKSLRRPPA